MRSFKSSAFALGLITFTVAACSTFSGSEGSTPGATPGDDPNGANADPKAPPVGGPPPTEELTETFGVFVANSGADGADGTRERPLSKVQAAIDLAKKVGKRVYVCTGVYREALVLADSISVIGGLDCSTTAWRTGAPRTRIDAPTSPAVRATGIVTATRVEALEILAPAAAAPSGSSIGLHADHASALVIANSRIAAGDAAKGDDGVEGVALVQAASANGAAARAGERCVGAASACLASPTYKPPRTIAGTNTCEGAAGFVAEAGGYGGSGGSWKVYQPPPVGGFTFPLGFDYYDGNAALNAEPGNSTPNGGAGADGASGQNAAPLGVLSVDGYLPADGASGANGSTGSGGAGGAGTKPHQNGDTLGAKWAGATGASGGAGGCPGLAGTAGKGGGASIGALLIESALTFDSSVILGAHGGAAGLGAFGSAPTGGGQAGANLTGYAEHSAQPGGRGGSSGVSGNGSAGPSVGVAHIGPAPKIVGSTKVTPGAGGDPIGERTTTDAFSTTRTIPATPAGLSKDILAL